VHLSSLQMTILRASAAAAAAVIASAPATSEIAAASTTAAIGHVKSGDSAMSAHDLAMTVRPLTFYW
jgi:hypothetical protein